MNLLLSLLLSIICKIIKFMKITRLFSVAAIMVAALARLLVTTEIPTSAAIQRLNYAALSGNSNDMENGIISKIMKVNRTMATSINII